MKREYVPVKRRSLTIKEENDKKIQYIRSQFLYSNIDIDYTKMVNIFIELGDMVLKPGIYTMENIVDIFKKYLGDIDNDIILNVLKNYQNKNMTKEIPITQVF